jgi:hypothetical protein
MDEQAWRSATDPRAMLEFLNGKASDRKLRLFACACCRRLWPLLVHQESKDSVEALERHADGLLDQSGFTNAWVAASHVRIIRKTRKRDSSPEKTAAWAVSTALFPETFRGVSSSASLVRRAGHVSPEEEDRRQCGDLRCLFGNPFRPLPRRTFPTHVVGLAEAIYAAFPAVSEDYAILADALEELGEAGAAAHCRQDSHARSCYVVDWITGKEAGRPAVSR